MLVLRVMVLSMLVLWWMLLLMSSGMVGFSVVCSGGNSLVVVGRVLRVWLLWLEMMKLFMLWVNVLWVLLICVMFLSSSGSGFLVCS